ncbi:EamA family transporter [Paenibacillus sp. TH7-28]
MLALIPTIFGHFVFNLLLKYIGATTVSVGIIGEPVLAIILAFVFLGEIISFSQFIGGLFTMVGMGMYFWAKSRKNDPNRKNAIGPKNTSQDLVG